MKKHAYRCVIVYMRFPDDPFPVITSGSWEGYITEKLIGANGLDMIHYFIYPNMIKLLHRFHRV